MRITFSQKFKFFILLIIFLLPLIFPLAVDAFGPNPIYCFGREDCDRITCILTRVCADDQKGCNVSCINDGPVCPMQSACTIKQGIATDRCGYYPIQPSCTITANPSTGSPTTLTWSSDTQSCTGSWTGDPLPPSGSTVVYPSGSTTYTLTCANNCLDGSLSTTCSVVAGVRHENCCDNWGWNNVSRCGGCCGPAANCVGYDASAPYYWHNSNDLWQCSYSDSSNSIYHLTQVNGCLSGNNPPDMPTLVAPPHNTWINYNPTFQATVSDPDNNQVRAHFDITSFGTGISSYVNSGQTASWGPVAIADGDWWWRAKAQDTDGLFSASTAYWLLRKDTVKPVAIIDQENGESIDNLIWVNLTESDERSGIAEGDVDVRINGGAWTNTGLPNGGSTTDDFIYTAVSVPAQVAYTNSGAFTWAALTGVNTVTAEVWGGGGGGGSWPDPNAAGGGGGGAYSKKTNISVTPGNNYTVVVGAGGARGITGDPGNNDGSTGGDSSFVNTSTVLAKGGVGGKGGSPSSAGGAGGAATSGVGDTKYSGGTGGTGVLGAYPSDTGGGGGGSSAGTGVNGNNGANGSGSTGGAGGTAPT